MTEIRLANGRGVALIDDDDAERIPLTGWCLHNNGYAQHRALNDRGRHTHVLLHRLIMRAQRGQELDHINHVKLDCRKVNLRFVTRSENNQNWSGACSHNKVGARGVISYKTKSGVRFRAGVQLGSKTVYRWGIQTLAEAAAIAVELRREHFTHSPENRT